MIRKSMIGAVIWLLGFGMASAMTPSSWTMTTTYASSIDQYEAQHARHLIATRDAVYALSRKGKLLKFPFDGSQSIQQRLPGRVVGISVDKNSRLWALVFEELSNNAFLLTPRTSDKDAYSDRYPGWKVSAKLPLREGNEKKDIASEGLYAVAAGDKSVLVLTSQRVAILDKKSGAWHTVALKKPLDEYEMDNPVALAQDDRRIWFGTDNGEWGGYLIMADAQTGEDRKISKNDPVTAIVPDLGQPDCILFALGLSHLFMESGGLYKSCEGEPVSLTKINAPIWDLIVSGNNLYALSRDMLIPIQNDTLDESKKISLPNKLDKAISGVPATVVNGILMVYSAARAEVSTSGLTPYAVAIPQGAKLNLQPWAPPEKGSKDCKANGP